VVRKSSVILKIMKVTFLTVIILLSITPIPASATNHLDFVAEINRRAAELARQKTAKPQPKTTTPKPKTAKVTVQTSVSQRNPLTLTIGNKGIRVSELQRFLTQTGDFTYPTITGYFGSVTATAVKKYQCRLNIVCSGTPTTTGYGQLGPSTRRAVTERRGISNITQAPTTQTTTTQQPAATTEFTLTRNLYIGTRGNDVTKLQTFLKTTGDFTYPEITGYYGNVTAQAVQRYQCREMSICGGTTNSNGYGVVGPRTRALLHAERTTVAITNTFNNTPIQPTTPNITVVPSGGGGGSGGTGSSGGGNTSPNILVPIVVPTTLTPPSITSTPPSQNQSCTFNNQTIISGSFVTAYQTNSVSYDSQCVSEQRACFNSSLSGSYVYTSCTVETKPTSTNLPGVKIGAYFVPWYVSHDNDYFIVNNDKNSLASRTLTMFAAMKRGAVNMYKIDQDALTGGTSSCENPQVSTQWCDQMPDLENIVSFPLDNVQVANQTVRLKINLIEMELLYGDLSLRENDLLYESRGSDSTWKRFKGILEVKKFWKLKNNTTAYFDQFLPDSYVVSPEPLDNSRLRYAVAEAPETISLQKKLAHSYGLDYFAMEWYWSYDSNHQNKEIAMKQAPLHTFFFDTPQEEDFTGALNWIIQNLNLRGLAENHKQAWDDEAVKTMCDRLTPFVSSDQYTEMNGKAILFVNSANVLFENLAENNSQFIKGFNDLQSCIKTNTGKDLAFVANGRIIDQRVSIPDRTLADAGFVYIVSRGPEWNQVRDYESYGSDLSNYWSQAQINYPSLKVIPGIMLSHLSGDVGKKGSGRYRQNNEIYKLDSSSTRTLSPNLDAANGSTPLRFRKNLVDATNYVLPVAAVSEAPVLIHQWNNYLEGAILEPEQTFGCLYLDAVSSVVEKNASRAIIEQCPNYVLK